jgi:hypothetical protein
MEAMAARELIDRVFGGTAEAGAILGVRPNTVSAWKRRGHLPRDAALRMRAHRAALRRGWYYDIETEEIRPFPNSVPTTQ